MSGSSEVMVAKTWTASKILIQEKFSNVPTHKYNYSFDYMSGSVKSSLIDFFEMAAAYSFAVEDDLGNNYEGSFNSNVLKWNYIHTGIDYDNCWSTNFDILEV
jgi:hypothetical protein